MRTNGGEEDTLVAEALPVESIASGRYLVRRRLGGGSQKVVYLVHDQELDRECALSVLHSDTAPSDADVLRFRREARAMARLGAHPNVVTVFDIGVDDGRPFLVCELVSGGDLRDELRRANGPLPVERAIAISNDLLSALDFCHGRGVIHRDIKPANIWITPAGIAKVGDFGMARAADWSRVTAAGMLLGTPSYMSPEQARGEPASERSDLYAVGCVMHEMLTGRPPFEADDLMGLLYQHVHVPPPPVGMHNGVVPRGIERFVLRMLGKDPAERPPSSADALSELASASTDNVARHHAPDVSETPLFGRNEELAHLTTALERALSGQGRLCLIAGEGGIGKSRLVAALAREAAGRGARVFTGAAAEADGGTPYLPWAQALAPLLQGSDSAVRSVVSGYSSWLERLLPSGHAQASSIAATGPERFATFQAVASALVSLAAKGGLLLLLEDLHWADKPSLLLLSHVARQIGSSRVLVVGTYRDTDVDRRHPLAEALADLRRERLYDRVVLRGLAPDEARAMIRSLGDPSDTLVEGIIRETEGNPFFIVELLRHVAEAGTATIAELGLPEGVREVIGRRLSRLSPECNRLLALASIVGNAFSWATVALASGSDEEGLLDLLDEALTAQIIRERADGASYEFTHALIRQTLREELSAPRRARLHRQIASAMERAYGAHLEPHRAEIAAHLIRAGTGEDVRGAIPHALAAAERARRVMAIEDAIPLLESARSGLEMVGGEPQLDAEVLIALGEAKIQTGDVQGGKRDCRAAIDIARSIGDAALEARAALSYASHFTFGVVMADNVEALQAALGALPDADSGLRARVLARLASAMQPADDFEEPIRIALDAIDMARRVADPPTLLAVLHTGLSALVDLGPPDIRRMLNDEMLTLAERLGDRAAVLRAHLRLVFDHMEVCDVPGADRHLEELARLARSSRHAGFEAFAKLTRAMRHFMIGEFAEGERLANEASLIGAQLSDENVRRTFMTQRFLSLQAQGRCDEAMQDAEQLVCAMPGEWGEIIVAACAARAGRIDEYRDMGKGALKHIGAVVRSPVNLAVFVDAMVHLLSPEDIAKEYEKALPHAERLITWGVTAMTVHSPMHRCLALLAAAVGRFDDADLHFADARAMALRLGMTPCAASLSLERAATLFGRPDAERHRPRALAILAEARAEAYQLGMTHVVAQMDALSAQHGR